jgi:hypothetical protein
MIIIWLGSFHPAEPEYPGIWDKHRCLITPARRHSKETTNCFNSGSATRMKRGTTTNKRAEMIPKSDDCCSAFLTAKVGLRLEWHDLHPASLGVAPRPSSDSSSIRCHV